MKRIYWETIKKNALKVGIPAGVAGFALLFWYLSLVGAITITGFTGDQICSGTIEDPCIAIINFTANEDIFIYPTDYDPWGRDTPFSTDVELESWKMYRSWGTGWREIKLNKTCQMKWCGAPYNNMKDNKYSFAFREDREYTIKIEVIKKYIDDNIKWGFADLDPIFYGLNNESLKKEFDEDKKEIKLKSKIDDSLIFNMTLDSEYVYSVVKGKNRTVAYFTLENNYKKYPWKSILQENELYLIEDDGELRSINRKYWYEYRFISGYEQAPNQIEQVCELSENKTMSNCQVSVLSYYNKTIYGWEKLDLKKKMDKGEIKLRLVLSEVYHGETGEWIVTTLGYRNPEFAIWSEAISNKVVSCWTFDEPSGTKLIDYGRGQLNNGTSNGVVVNIPSQIASLDKAYYFDGGAATDVQIIPTTSLNLTGDLSLGIIMNSTQANGGDFAGKVNVAGYPMGIAGDNAFTKFVPISGGLGDAIYGTTEINTGTAVLMVGTHTEANTSIFVNGSLETTATTAAGALKNSAVWEFGSTSVLGNFVGFVSEAWVMNDSLSDSENAEIWNNGDVISCAASANPPTIAFVSPADAINLSTNSVDIQILPADTEDASGLFSGIYSNSTGSWHINATNTSAYSGVNTNISVVWQEGTHLYAGVANDTTGDGPTLTATNRTLLIDLTNPSINYNTSTESDNAYLNRDYAFVNITAIDVTLHSVRLNWDGTNETFATNAGSNYWENKTGLSDGNYTFYGWANDSLSHYTLLAEREILIDTTIPLIEFVTPAVNNSVTDKSYIPIEVSVTETNPKNITYVIANDSVWNTTTYTMAAQDSNNTINFTNLVDGSYQINVTVFDLVNNANSTDTWYVSITDFRMFFNNIEGNNTAELRSTLTLLANSTINMTICVDILHPVFGVNYSCLANNTLSFDFLINSFNKTNFSDGTQNKTFNFTGVSVNNATFKGHQYDEMHEMEFNITGTNDPRDVLIFHANTTPDLTNQSQFERLIDRFYDGIMRGNNVNVYQTYDNVNETNLTFNTGGEQIIYFMLDDVMATKTDYTFLINITGDSIGFNYIVGNSTTGLRGFKNYSDIDTEKTIAQLDPSGAIMSKNTSEGWYFYDDFQDGTLNQSLWSNGTCTIAGSTANCADETGGKMRIRSVINDPYSTATSQVVSDKLSRFESDTINFSISGTYDGSEHSTGETSGSMKLRFGYNYFWNLTTLDAVQPSTSEDADMEMDVELTKINKTYWRVRLWGTENATAGGNPSSPSEILYSGDTTLIEVNTSVLFAETASTRCANCGESEVLLYFDEVNQSLWTRVNGTVVSIPIFNSNSDIDKATVWLSGKVIGYGAQNFTVYLSPDDGDNWESVGVVWTSGATGTFSNFLVGTHTFTNPGQNLRFKVDFNSSDWNFNDTNQIHKINISVATSDPSNISLDFGNDGIAEETLSGVINSTNGTITVNLSFTDLSSAFTNANRWENIIKHNHVYKIPLSINTTSRGFITVNGINITYNPNPVVINITNVSNTLGNDTNFSVFRIPIGAFNLTATAVNVTVDDINTNYSGGNQTIIFQLHDSLNTLTEMFSLTYYYSSFFRVLPYTWTDNIFFLPRTNSSQNVSAYGQTQTTPLLNITTTNYGGKNLNLSISVNQSFSCINFTWNDSNNIPPTGNTVNTTLQEISNDLGYLNNQSVWLWANLTDCNASNARILNPKLNITSYCVGCLWK